MDRDRYRAIRRQPSPKEKGARSEELGARVRKDKGTRGQRGQGDKGNSLFPTEGVGIRTKGTRK
ncbi:hypothetical protein [Chroococcidiopsis cubana]|uniref:hypothetical protein n=1 Tax=Chroococcidiopsis cubana TaxID=171392 RepID=UPI002ACE5833|nr:hypothetical protein [Chroococcidiopsis cubana]